MSAITTRITVDVDELGPPQSSWFYHPTVDAGSPLAQYHARTEATYLMWVDYPDNFAVKGTPEQITEWAESLIAHVHEAAQAEQLRRRGAGAATEPVAAVAP